MVLDALYLIVLDLGVDVPDLGVLVLKSIQLFLVGVVGSLEFLLETGDHLEVLVLFGLNKQIGTLNSLIFSILVCNLFTLSESYETMWALLESSFFLSNSQSFFLLTHFSFDEATNP